MINWTLKTMKDYEDEYIVNLLHDLNVNIVVVGGTGLFSSEGQIKEIYRKMNIEELARHLFPNSIEFKIHNRRVIDDPLKMKIEMGVDK